MRQHAKDAPKVSKRELILEIRRQLAYATKAHRGELAANARAFELSKRVTELERELARRGAASRARKNALAVANARIARGVARVGGLRPGNARVEGEGARAAGESSDACY